MCFANCFSFFVTQHIIRNTSHALRWMSISLCYVSFFLISASIFLYPFCFSTFAINFTSNVIKSINRNYNLSFYAKCFFSFAICFCLYAIKYAFKLINNWKGTVSHSLGRKNKWERSSHYSLNNGKNSFVCSSDCCRTRK